MATIITTMNKVLSRRIDVDVFEQAVAQTNWNTITISTSARMNGWKESSGAQNDMIDFNVILIKGIWNIELLYVKNTNNGIVSVQIDGVEQGTIDTYAASVTYNNRTTISNVTINTTGKKTLRLKMTSKNASSSNYVGEVQHIQLRCTAVSDATAVRIDPDTQMPWHIDVVAFMTPASHTNFDTPIMSSNKIYKGLQTSSGAQNAEINFSVLLAAGTWTFELLHETNSNIGIYSVQLDGVQQGTVDGYTAPQIPNVRSQIAGIAVATTAVYTLKLKMATKNASSSAYYGAFQHIQMRRTA